MAKVLISIPDELLGRIDAQAKSLGTSRSGYLRSLAERDLPSDEQRRAEVNRLMGLILSSADRGEPMPDAAQMIREDRESH